MTDWHGNLRKMTTELADPVRYTVLPDEAGPASMICWGKRSPSLLPGRSIVLPATG